MILYDDRHNTTSGHWFTCKRRFWRHCEKSRGAYCGLGHERIVRDWPADICIFYNFYAAQIE